MQKPKRKELQQQLEEGLLEEIRVRSGGKFRFREKVSAILRVVYPIAGVRPAQADSLRKREYRKRKLASRVTIARLAGH
jgi:predicted house-cleaning noncanonical NTP pyrophosphatase (MazG superfamily)